VIVFYGLFSSNTVNKENYKKKTNKFYNDIDWDLPRISIAHDVILKFNIGVGRQPERQQLLKEYGYATAHGLLPLVPVDIVGGGEILLLKAPVSFRIGLLLFNAWEDITILKSFFSTINLQFNVMEILWFCGNQSIFIHKFAKEGNITIFCN